jgi:hypothetical protein
VDWTARGWKAAKDVLPGVVCNDGDDEGAIFLDRLPTAAEATAIRKMSVCRSASNTARSN